MYLTSDKAETELTPQLDLICVLALQCAPLPHASCTTKYMVSTLSHILHALHFRHAQHEEHTHTHTINLSSSCERQAPVNKQQVTVKSAQLPAPSKPPLCTIVKSAHTRYHPNLQAASLAGLDKTALVTRAASTAVAACMATIAPPQISAKGGRGRGGYLPAPVTRCSCTDRLWFLHSYKGSAALQPELCP